MNARFWVFENDGWIKLTLKPGQSLTWSHGGRDEEGYSWTGERWTFDGLLVINESSYDGRDCDGRISRETVLTCPVGFLQGKPAEAARLVTFGQEDPWSFEVWEPMPPRPEWERARASQRDYSAEAMGY